MLLAELAVDVDVEVEVEVDVDADVAVLEDPVVLLELELQSHIYNLIASNREPHLVLELQTPL